MKGGGNRFSTEYTRSLVDSTPKSSKGDNCDEIDFNTELRNVDSSITKYSKGDVLEVQLDGLKRIVAVGIHGQCGVIIYVNAIQLKNCIEKGKEFIAVILDFSVSHCNVRVKRKI